MSDPDSLARAFAALEVRVEVAITFLEGCREGISADGVARLLDILKRGQARSRLFRQGHSLEEVNTMDKQEVRHG